MNGIEYVRRASGLVAPRDSDTGLWRVKWQVERRLGEWSGDRIDGDPAAAAAALRAYEDAGLGEAVTTREGNLLMYGGVSCLWQTLIGNGTATAAQTLTYFNNGNAYIGVGDSSTAAAATQTDLQAASNKLRVAMDATYPLHTDGTTSGAATITFRSTFATGQANFAWQEWAVFNGSSGGRMLNRKVESLGTKTSASSWTITVTITIA